MPDSGFEPLNREQIDFIGEQTKVAHAIGQLDPDRLVANVLRLVPSCRHYLARVEELERKRDALGHGRTFAPENIELQRRLIAAEARVRELREVAEAARSVVKTFEVRHIITPSRERLEAALASVTPERTAAEKPNAQ